MKQRIKTTDLSVKCLKNYLNLENVSSDYMDGIAGLDLYALLNEVEEEGFPGEMGIDDLMNLSSALDDLYSAIQVLKPEIKKAVDCVYDRKNVSNIISIDATVEVEGDLYVAYTDYFDGIRVTAKTENDVKAILDKEVYERVADLNLRSLVAISRYEINYEVK